MRAKTIALLLASAGLLLGSALSASAQTKPAADRENVTSDLLPYNSRERALRARAEAPPEAAPVRGRLRDPEGLADLADREETVGAGGLGADRGDGAEGKK